MPYPKLTDTNYKNFGGINSKVSPYATGPEEFSDIRNMDFVTPGSLTKRPGSTQFLSTGVSGRITGLYEMNALNGASYVVFGANTNLYYVQANAGTAIMTGLQDSALFAFTTFVDRMFFANGSAFMKWKAGATATLFSLPSPVGANTTLEKTYPGTTILGDGNTFWAASFISFGYGFVNDRGFHGAVGNFNPVLVYGASGGFNYVGLTGDTMSIGGTQINVIQNLAAIGQSYGLGYTVGFTFISATLANSVIGSSLIYAGAAVYRNAGPGTPGFLSNYVPITSLGGQTFIGATDDFIVGGAARYQAGVWCNPNDRFYLTNAGAFPMPTHLWFTMFPRYLEIYNNQLFLSGFSTTPSVCWFSNIGEPESIEPTYNFEVRTNDGDRVTGLKSYQSQLFIFKEKSFHALSGDNPDNFSLREISDQYGCLSGRAVATYENNMVFLDRKGVCQYNGANIVVISTKIEPIFQSMNVDAAKDNAVMIHNRLRNQIWVGIPTNGSTVNNTTLVFDYVVQAWTVYEGFSPSSLAVIKGPLTQPDAMYGSYSSGSLFNFGVSFFSDNGQGISLLCKTRFLQDLEESTEKQYRRLHADFNTVAGSTAIIKVDFFQDYGASIVHSATLAQNVFQSRLDFGIPAKSLSFQISHFSAAESLKLHGFTISYRFQRPV